MAKVFAGFTPDQLGKIDPILQGVDSDTQQQIIAANPSLAARVGKLSDIAQKKVYAASGGYIKGYAAGGMQNTPRPTVISVMGNEDDKTPKTEEPEKDAAAEALTAAGKAAGQLAETAIKDPSKLVSNVDVTKFSEEDKAAGKIAEGTGQLTEPAPTATLTEAAADAGAVSPEKTVVSTVDATKVAQDVKTATDDIQAAQGKVREESKVKAEEGQLSEAAKAAGVQFDKNYIDDVTAGIRTVTLDEMAQAQGLDEEAVQAKIAEANVPENIKAAQGTVQPEEIPQAAQIKESDMAQAEAITADGLDDDAVAVAAKLEAFNVDEGTLAEFKEGKIEAQDTVQGQLESLMKSFDNGTPAWAAGAMRAANAAMASRGLGGSSIAAAAIIQASMESALPIAKADADAFRSMKMDNLSRQQQISLANAAAQQGVKLNNFNAEQQAALQNSQNAFSLQSQNLSNTQQAVLANAQIKAALQGQNLSNRQQANMAEAARYAEMANINLNNRQQGILQDNSNQMQVTLANLNAKQQAYIANAQIEAALQGKKMDNKQQVAIANAAKFSDANNITFTAEQQAQLHNSELMKTVGLAELNSMQAAVLQNAAQTASMDMANLNNRQQAAVQNAQAFLQMDMTNLSNEQQATMFKNQSIVQSLFSDQAAENAAKQFNASSQNQTDQFFADLSTRVSMANSEQKNIMSRFNAGEANAISQFNTQLSEQRNQFNSANNLVIAQANAQWAQSTTTIENAAQNEANRLDAQRQNEFTALGYNTTIQQYRDLMSYAWKTGDNDAQRGVSLAIAKLQADSAKYAADVAASSNAAATAAQKTNTMWTAIGAFAGNLDWGSIF